MAYKDLTFLLFAKDMSATRGFEKVAHSGDAMAKGISGSMGMAGLAIAGLAVSLTAKSVRMAADFQSATTRLVTDAGESSRTIGQLSAGLLDISASTGTGAEEIAKGMYKVSSAGYTMAHGGLKVMQAAAEGAKIGGADLTTVADALTTTMKDYGLTSGKANSATSELITTVSLGKTTMEDLAGSMHNVLPNAQALGIHLNDVLGALATMTQEGISADQASQNLNHTIVSMANPTNVQTQAMAAMGLNSTKVAAQLGKKGITGTLNELVTAITHNMKGGLVLQRTFTDSKLAAQSASTMFKALPTSVQATATAYQKGAISQKTWTSAVKAMTPANANLAKQWSATENRAKGFSQALTSGSGPAKTFTAELARMTGGQVGLQTALHLTGIHGKDAADAVTKIGKAAKGAHKDVTDWAKTQHTFNQQQSDFGAEMGKLGIEIGTVLLPPLTDFIHNLIDGGHQIGDFVHVAVHDFKDGFNQITGFFGGTVHNFQDGFGQITGFFTGMIHNFQDGAGQMGDIGKHIVDGLVGGLQNAWGGLMGTIHDLGMKLPKPIRDALGIKSPSKVFFDIGTYVGQGLEKGLLGSVSNVQTASSTLAGTVISAFKAKHSKMGAGTENSLLHLITGDEKKLSALAGNRAGLQTKLGNLKTSRSGVYDNTKSATIGAGDITGFAAPGDAVQGLRALVGKTNTFKGDLKSLMKKGVSGAMLDQLVQGWNSNPDGALATANGLLANPTDLKQILSLDRALASAAGGLGSMAAHGEYDSQINATSGKIKVDTWRMQQIARNEAQRVATGTHVTVNLSGHYAGTKDDLAKTITQVIRDAEKKGIISKNWAKG